jgi:hypothetical protein
MEELRDRSDGESSMKVTTVLIKAVFVISRFKLQGRELKGGTRTHNILYMYSKKSKKNSVST